MTKYNSSNQLPSVDPRSKKLQQTELKLLEKFTTKYLKEYAGFNAKEIKEIFVKMQNKEMSGKDISVLCRINFPGKKGVEYREKLEPVMNELNAIYRKQLQHILLGA